MTNCYACRVAPFGYLRIIACLTAPHSFSQLTTPFIAPPRLGIHHTPFVACPSSLFHVELPRAYTRLLYFTYLLSKSCFPLITLSDQTKEIAYSSSRRAMELIGIEPMTSGLQSRRSPN
jgi:hypothetical protein